MTDILIPIEKTKQKCLGTNRDTYERQRDGQ